MLMTIGLCLFLFGTGEADQVARKVEKDLKSAKYLKVSYSTEGGTLQEAMLITDSEEVRSVTATIGVEETQEGLQAGLIPMCRVVFILPDGKMMEINLAGRKSLDQSFWGQIYLRDERVLQEALRGRLEACGAGDRRPQAEPEARPEEGSGGLAGPPRRLPHRLGGGRGRRAEAGDHPDP